ncbi:MAG: repressor LexA [Micavibrio sp.]|nr:repressor LexA [Micavibrio sp.]HCK32342.1 repressor LexA [Rhodospirillaceae bacterium]
MLTQKQRDLLVFIHERLESGGVAPSFDEMKDHLGLASKSGIHRLITGLVERGFLERLPNRARALNVIKLPDGYKAGNDSAADTQPKGNVAQFKRPASGGMAAFDKDVQSIPLYGKIAAGTAIEAIRHEGNNIDIPASMLGASEYYALTVEGDSMINAGIHDSDIVVIERTSNVRDGDIVVALVDGEEVTLKRIKKEGHMVALIPENPDYEIRFVEAHRVEIQGKLASLMRTYQ